MAATRHEVDGRPWRTGFWRRAPFTALSSLLAACLCAVAAVLVLIFWNGQPLDYWQIAGHNVQPGVLLSVLATLGNTLFRYSFKDGATISWWVRAHRGSSLAGLNACWDSAQSTIPSLTSFRHLGNTTFASMAVLLLLIVGPLLQRSSTVTVVQQQTRIHLTLPVSPDPFLSGITGYYGNVDDDPNVRYYTPLFLGVLQQYNQRAPIKLPVNGTCEGKCDFDLIAAGWDVDCHSWTSPYRLISVREINEYMDAGGQDPFLNGVSHRGSNSTSYSGPDPSQVMFWSNVTYEAAAKYAFYDLVEQCGGGCPASSMDPYIWNPILLSSMTKSTEGGNGSTTWRYCLLQEGVQRYPVTITNSTVTVLPMDTHQNYTVFKFPRYNEDQGIGHWPSTLGGFALALKLQFAGHAFLGMDFANNTGLITIGSSPLMYVNSQGTSLYDSYNITWEDSIDDMITMLRELSLRMAIQTSLGAKPLEYKPGAIATFVPEDERSIIYLNGTRVNSTVSQTVQASMGYDQTVYESHFDWLSGALAAMALAFVAILLTFNGWWHLGRAVDMSPMEIARAFDAPLLREGDPNGTAKDLVRSLGDRRVQYGAAASTKAMSPLLNRNSPREPAMDRNEDDVENMTPKRQLVFGREGTVEVPTQGETFHYDTRSGLID